MVTLTINTKKVQLDADPQMPLLWAIRDMLGLTGTKFGCGKGLCGSCTILVDGNAVRSCMFPVIASEGKNITTIEGLSEKLDHPVQVAWQKEKVPQCGYCQAGQILSAVALLESNNNPDDKAIDGAMSGNICRCGTYPRIKKAIKRAAVQYAGGK